jgi:hypothetical protein
VRAGATTARHGAAGALYAVLDADGYSALIDAESLPGFICWRAISEELVMARFPDGDNTLLLYNPTVAAVPRHALALVH